MVVIQSLGHYEMSVHESHMKCDTLLTSFRACVKTQHNSYIHTPDRVNNLAVLVIVIAEGYLNIHKK